MKKALIYPTVILGVGIFIGILLVSNFSLSGIANIFAQDSKLGADRAPVNPDASVSALNQAMVKASEAILPTVVYIDVKGEVKSQNRGDNSEGFGGFGGFDFFDFFQGPQGGKIRGSGSGVIVSSDGYIVTNNHVVKDASDKGIKVQTFDKKEYDAKIIGTDEYTDLALIKIEAKNLPVAHFGDINSVKVGEMVFAVGNPIGLSHTVTQGIVSAIGRGSLSRKGGANIEHYIQTDAAINPGNSGGGLFNIYGSLIGINTAIATENGGFMGYGFAIPIDMMQSVVQDLMDDGKINRGYIGVQIESIDEVMAKGLGLSKVQGVLVQKVVEDGAAKKAGIEAQDVILEVDGKEVNSSSELQSKIVLKRAGDKVNLTIWRDNKKINKTVTLKSMDGDEIASEKGSSNSKNDDESGSKSNEPVKFENLGFSVKPLTSDMKKDLEVSNGVLVTDVSRYSSAADRGLFPNSVILSADKKEIKSTGDLKKIIDSKKNGDVVILNVKYRDSNRIVALEISN